MSSAKGPGGSHCNIFNNNIIFQLKTYLLPGFSWNFSILVLAYRCDSKDILK